MRYAALLAVLLLAPAAVQASQRAHDPDWPCMQIRMPTLSLGAVWDGPSVEPYLATWSSDAAVAALAREVAQRRLPLAAAEQQIRAFAAAAGAQKQSRLLALTAGVFSSLDEQRSQVVAGLDRFGRRQKELATQIRTDMARLRSAQDAAAQTQDTQQLADQVGWETQLFEQRRQAVSYACDVPNRIEQRLYALAHSIRRLLD